MPPHPPSSVSRARLENIGHLLPLLSPSSPMGNPFRFDSYVSPISEITPQISLGSIDFTEQDLNKLGITHILNISNTEDPFYPGIKSLFIPPKLPWTIAPEDS